MGERCITTHTAVTHFYYFSSPCLYYYEIPAIMQLVGVSNRQATKYMNVQKGMLNDRTPPRPPLRPLPFPTTPPPVFAKGASAHRAYIPPITRTKRGGMGYSTLCCANDEYHQ